MISKKHLEDALNNTFEEVERLEHLFVVALRHIRNLEAGIAQPTEASRTLEPWLRHKRTADTVE